MRQPKRGYFPSRPECFIHYHSASRSRVLMGTLWRKGFGWDYPLPSESQVLWKDVAVDLTGLSDLRFERQAEFLLNPDSVTLQKDKTVPVLELMAVYLVLKRLPTILDNCESQ